MLSAISAPPYWFRDFYIFGRAMPKAVSPFTVEAPVRARLGPCGISDEQRSIGTGLPPISSVFPCLYHSTMAFHTHIVITWGMNNRLIGGRSSETVSLHRHEKQQLLFLFFSSSFPFPFVPLQRRGCLVAPLFL
jgi:hypothetical protein